MRPPAESSALPASLAQRFLLVYRAVALLLTATAIFQMWQDQSWGALCIAIIYAPIANLILMALGLIAAGLYLRRHPTIRKGKLLSSVISTPLIGVILTFASLFLMDLHGC